MTTNLKGDKFPKKIDMRLNSKFVNFIELYEEIFDIDLYAYKLKFMDRATNK
jgi:hypothetical protein